MDGEGKAAQQCRGSSDLPRRLRFPVTCAASGVSIAIARVFENRVSRAQTGERCRSRKRASRLLEVLYTVTYVDW